MYKDTKAGRKVSRMKAGRGKGKGKGKVHPRTSHKRPEGEYRHSSTLSLTSALDGGGWSTPRHGRFTPGKDPVPIV
jgi:hypothetical protein